MGLSLAASSFAKRRGRFCRLTLETYVQDFRPEVSFESGYLGMVMKNHNTENVIFISVVNNYDLYNTCVTGNVFIKNISGISCVDFDNTRQNEFISRRYNQFLDGYNYANSAWFVFCHNDWEIMEDIRPHLVTLDKANLYGPIGTFLYKNMHGHLLREYYGGCL